jgi:hypothetical protein
MDTASAATSTTAIASTKNHYVILDGLRGVASLLVVAFHLFEPFSHENAAKQIINHGYLAVDFFFMLSGFVIAYAYDDRWTRMGQWEFYKRRLIRLQPMVIMGSLLGAALFYFQQGPTFPLIAATPVWKMLLVMIVGCTLLPLPISMDIRGWQEMHPLNGPASVPVFRGYSAQPARSWHPSEKCVRHLQPAPGGCAVASAVRRPTATLDQWPLRSALRHLSLPNRCGHRRRREAC